VADYGGGFVALARLLGSAMCDKQVEVVEPHPHAAAIALAAATPNVRNVPELTGHYVLLIATDVFTHVPDPIDLAFSTTRICAGVASI
jgi:site-specific recombinase XerC